MKIINKNLIDVKEKEKIKEKLEEEKIKKNKLKKEQILDMKYIR